MGLYAIGDLHLHFQSECKSVRQQTDPVWRDHEAVFLRNCQRLLTQEDTLVLLGDHSWGRNPSECERDLAWITELPGRKILLRGNHDAFWDAGRTPKLNALYEGRLHFLQDNYFTYRDYALVGTKGYCFEGPFYLDRRGRVKGWDEEAEQSAEKLIQRELVRLRRSFEAARKDGHNRFLYTYKYTYTFICILIYGLFIFMGYRIQSSL